MANLLSLKNFSKGVLQRLKPRWQFRWIFITLLWLVIILYLGFGIVFGITIYKNHSTSNLAQFYSKIFPFPASIANSRIVWVKNFYDQYSYISQFSQKSKQPIDENVLRSKIMDQLEENKLLEIQAAKYGIRVYPKEVDAAYDKISKDVEQAAPELGGDLALKKVLNTLYGKSATEFKAIMIKPFVLKEKIQNELIVQVKVSHILIRDEGRANEIADRAKKGESFGDLAKQYSEDTNSRDKGGSLDWLARGQLVVNNKSVPEFDDAVFKAKVGDIVGPIKTEFGFEIVKIEDRKGKIDENYNDWLNNLKKQARIYRLLK